MDFLVYIFATWAIVVLGFVLLIALEYREQRKNEAWLKTFKQRWGDLHK